MPYVVPVGTRGVARPVQGPQGGGGPTRGEITDAAATHFLGLAHILGPLIMFLVKGRQSRWVREHAVEALNFHLSMLINTLVLMFVAVALVVFAVATRNDAPPYALGIIVLVNLAQWVFQAAFSIRAGVVALKGRPYRYPFSMRIIKP